MYYLGIAFPTCVSVNNCVCHFSPLKSDPIVTLANGNLVKVYAFINACACVCVSNLIFKINNN